MISPELPNQNLFHNIPPQELTEVLAQCPLKTLAPGDVLIQPGEQNRHMYLLLSGQLEVHLSHADSAEGFLINPGECIGEMSVIEGHPTSAFVVAQSDSQVALLSESMFWEVYLHLPQALPNLLRTLIQRMRKSNQIITDAMAQQLRYEALQKELAAAGKIQANILPQDIPLLADYPQIDVCASLEPAQDVGGDFFDAFALDKDHICVAVGDVSGKGMPAALFMVRVMTLLRMGISKGTELDEAVSTVNQMLCQNNEACMFLTLFVGVLNVNTGQMRYVNGGHNPPFFSKQGQPFEQLNVPKGILLGVLETAPYYVTEMRFQPGDTLLLYTDGVTEAQNTRSEFFGVDRALSTLSSASTEDAVALVNRLEKAIYYFAKGAPPSDDITILALRYQAG